MFLASQIKKIFPEIFIFIFSLFLFLSIYACNFEELEDEEPPIETSINNETTKPEEEKEKDVLVTAEEINPLDTPQGPSVVDFEKDIKLSESLILDQSKKFTTKVLSQSDYNTFLTDDGDVKTITNDIYKHYKDIFDFIIILGVETEQPQTLDFFGRNTTVQNNIQGIGGNIFNQSTRFGSDGKLKGVIYMPSTNYIKTGPFLHELVHVWANKDFIPTTVPGHWGYSSAGGQLGGFDTLTSLGNDTYKGTVAGRSSFGTFANGGNSIPYSNLELYVMGLIGENELQPVQVAINPKANGKPGEFTADSIKTFTVDELIERNGKRVPSVENSQKIFKTLTIIITPTPLSAEKKDEIINVIDPFFKNEDSEPNKTLNFWKATQGKASLENTVILENLL